MSESVTVLSLCSFKGCSNSGKCRCSVCKTWYCSKDCQMLHWPHHWRDCLPLPDLEWPDLTHLSSQLAAKPSVSHESDDLVKVGSAKIVQVNDASATKEETEKKAVKGKVTFDVSTPSKHIVDVNVAKTSPTDESERNSSRVKDKSSESNINQDLASYTPSKQVDAKKDDDIKLDVKISKQAELNDVPSNTMASTIEPLDSKVVPQKQVEPKEIPKMPTEAKASPSKPVEYKNSSKSVEPVPVSPNKTESVTKKSMYQEAYYSSKIAPQLLSQKVHEISLPLEEVQSPCNFVIRLLSEDSDCVEILQILNENVPEKPADNWKIGRNEVIAVMFEDLWYRGMAIKRKEDKFLCYLLDFGNTITVTKDLMRPLPEEYLVIPPYAYQVCLAGIGPVDSDGTFTEDCAALMKEAINGDPEYKFVAEFLGQSDNGRWIINLLGKDDKESLTPILIEAELGVTRDDVIDKTFEQLIINPGDGDGAEEVPKEIVPDVKSAEEVINSVKIVASGDDKKIEASPQEVVESPKPVEVSNPPSTPAPITGPIIPRGRLDPTRKDVTGGVCFFHTPNSFYVCSSDKIDAFTFILERSQIEVPGQVNPLPGTCCLTLDEQTCWYRGEILGFSDGDKTSVDLFLIDYGKVVSNPISELKPLPDDLQEPGLVVKVELRGVKPATGDEWTEAERHGSILILDVGGETVFKFKNLESKEDACLMDLEDLEGNDVASLMIETGCAAATVETFPEIPKSSLSPGVQPMLVLGAKSPMSIYLTPVENFTTYSDVHVPIIEKVAAEADIVLSANVGDVVLISNDGFWYRGRIVKVVDDDNVSVELIDFAVIKENVKKSELRRSNASICEIPELSFKCCLSGWIGKDEQEAQDQYGVKINKLLVQYTQVEVDVLETKEDFVKIKVDELEKKLLQKEIPALSRAALLKLKLKSIQ